MKGRLLTDQVVVEEGRDANKLHTKRYFGELEGGKLYLTLLEALYLVETEKLEVESEGQVLDFDRLLSLFLKDTEYMLKYKVYKDLRDKGLIVKTGFKYGCHFRVYRKGYEEHSEYLVHAIPEDARFSAYDIIKYVRLAHSVKKMVIFAFLDEEGDVTYNALQHMKM